MNVTVDITILVCLFIALGMSADFAVKRTKYISSKLKFPLFIIGVLLGIMTTLPELAIGLNSIAEGIPEVSVGNLLGGIIVTYGLVIGINLIVTHKIKTNKIIKSLVPILLVMLSPIPLGFDGKYTFSDGLILVLFYVGLLIYMYFTNPQQTHEELKNINEKRIAHSIIMTIASVIFILAITRAIVEVSTDLLTRLNMDEFTVGILVFAFGTNLPEILVTITSWKRKMSDISLSYLLSSAFTNIFVLGILSTIKPLTITLNKPFYILSTFLVIITLAFIYFCFSGKKLERKEGFVLLLIYIAFIAMTIWYK